METMQHRKRGLGGDKRRIDIASFSGEESDKDLDDLDDVDDLEDLTEKRMNQRRRYCYHRWGILFRVLVSVLFALLILQEYRQTHPVLIHHPSHIVIKSKSKATANAKAITIKSNPNFCALFQVYNHVARYEEEVLSTIRRLKRLNPQITTILVTDNPNLQRSDGGDTLDILHPIPPQKPTPLSYFGIKDFTLRLRYLSTITELELSPPTTCDLVLSLDSHVTVCSSNLYQQLKLFYDDPTFVMGTNVEHAPSWKASPMTFLNKSSKIMPHNFAVLIRPHPALQEFLKAWYTYMQSWSSLLQYGIDDQQPLAKLLVQLQNAPHLTRLQESLVLAEKSVDKSKYGFYPRFTYVYEGNVTLMHSYRRDGLPKSCDDDDSTSDCICALLNQPRPQEPRMLVRMSEEQEYEILTTIRDCRSRLGPYEPRICTDPGQLYGLQDATSWK